MASVIYQQVVKLAEQLTLDEQRALVDFLEERLEQWHLSLDEFQALLDSMVVDLGEALPTFSFRREE